MTAYQFELSSKSEKNSLNKTDIVDIFDSQDKKTFKG